MHLSGLGLTSEKVMESLHTLLDLYNPKLFFFLSIKNHSLFKDNNC